MKFSDYIESIEKFYIENGILIQPLPTIKLDWTTQDRFDPFIKTGYYLPEEMSITLYVKNRHLKDILRSFCHELVHHNQNLVSPEDFSTFNSTTGALTDNPHLEKLEGDAYLRGNLLFRKWTEEFTMK